MQRKIVTIGLCALFVGMVGLLALPGLSSAAPMKGPQNGTIEGVVVDENGAPVAFATVQLFADIPGIIDYLAETTADEDGKFKFKRVAAGDYTVVALFLTPGLVLIGNAPVTVVAKQTTQVTVVVSAP
jgi:hypothetical protein